MLPRKFKHHRVASDAEDEQPPGIRLESLCTTEVDTQSLLGQSTPNARKTIPSVTDETPTVLHSEAEDNSGAGKLWVPFFLRRTTLLLFAASFIVLLAALTVLWRVSEKQHGLSRVDSDNYYLWTYGPTAVFTIVSALWGQVEYRALQLFPWRLMSRGFVPASDSVLLDYLSMWNVSAMVKSLQRRHFIVAVAVAASLIIKLMTAISTVLFTAEDVHLTHSRELQVQKAFDGSTYNQSTIDGRVYLKSWGVAQHNLSNPAGTTTKHAFQNFFYDTSSTGSPIYLQNSTYKATVGVFTPSLECRETSVTTSGNTTDVELRTDDCRVVISGQTINQFTMMQTVLGSCDGVISEIGSIFSVDSEYDIGLDVKTIDWRLWMYVAQWKEHRTGWPVLYEGGSSNVSYVDIIGLTCQLSYSTNRGNVTLSGTEDIGQPSIDLAIDGPVDIPGLADISASSILYGSYLSVAQTSDTMYARDIDYLFLRTGMSSLKSIFDAGALTDRAAESVHALAVQLASEYLMTPSPGTVSGTVENEETRLTVRNVSVVVIAIILGLLALLSLLVSIFFLPYAVCSRDPGSIVGLAAILANSHYLMGALSGTGHSSKKELRKVLAGQTYTTTVNENTFLIEQRGPKVENKPAQSSQSSWWRPFSAAPLARALVILLPTCLIVVLEILYQKSRSSDGLANVSANSALSYTWTYIPALVMLGMRTLFESVYFSARVFQPYHELKRGHAPAERSIMDNQHRKVAVVGVWDALLKRQWAVMAAGVAVLIAPFLPIVVSGLYTASDAVSVSNITLTQLNRVNMSDGYFYVKVDGDEDMKLGDMIRQYNLSYPQWTYQNLSLPKVEVNTSSLDNETASALSTGGYFVEAQVPGLSLDLGCEEVPAEAYVAGPDPTGDPYIGVNVTTLTERCAFGTVSLGPTDYGPPGRKYLNGFDRPSAIRDLSELPNSCPGLVVAYGRVGPTSDKLQEITVLKCHPKIEQMDVHIRLLLPSYTFDLTSPPSVVSGSTTTLFDGYMGPMSELVAPDGDQVASAMLDIYPGDNSTKQLNAVFRSIIYGEGGVSAEALLDPGVLKARLQKVWSTVTAQMINNRGRQDYDDPEAPPTSIRERPTYPAKLHNPFRTRLFQNMVSTRILQAVLAAMIICGAASIFMMNTRNILPKNPLSIAAVASLLADSRFLDSSASASDHARSEGVIPSGSERSNGKRQLEQRGLFYGRTFTLGWWDTKMGVERTHYNEQERDSDVSTNEANSSRGSSIQDCDTADETRKRFGIDVDEELVP